MKYEIIENVLDDFEDLQNLWCNSSNISWFYNKSTLDIESDNNFMFTHHLYRNDQITSNFFNTIQELTYKVSILSGKSKLLRIKANMYTNQGKTIYHAKHTDYEDIGDFKTAVFNFTTCNGGTILYLDDEEINIPSVENTLLIFDGNILHSGYTQTDTHNRVLINFDFL